MNKQLNLHPTYRLDRVEEIAYKLIESCCYEMAIFKDGNTDYVYRLDRDDEVIGPLLCMCDPSHPIEELSADGYEEIVRYVNKQRAHLKYNA